MKSYCQCGCFTVRRQLGLCLQRWLCLYQYILPDNKVRELAPVCLPWQHWTKSLSMVWWRWHVSVSQLCCCWSMAVYLWVASITVCVCFGVPPYIFIYREFIQNSSLYIRSRVRWFTIYVLLFSFYQPQTWYNDVLKVMLITNFKSITLRKEAFMASLWMACTFLSM
jgi:hypothetical protein